MVLIFLHTTTNYTNYKKKENEVKMEDNKIIDRIKRQLNFVLMRTLNQTAADMALFRLPNKMQEVFDNPTTWILRGFRYRKATLEDLTAELYADDYVGPTPHKVLAAEVFGGPRKHKRFEVALISKGIMPSDQYAVPGRDAQIDTYGNIRGTQLVAILSSLQAFSNMGFVANKNAKGAGSRMNLFVINRLGAKELWFGGRESHLIDIANRAKGLPMGIYQRDRLRVHQLVKFVRQPAYEQRFKFFDYSNELIPKLMQQNFNRFFQE